MCFNCLGDHRASQCKSKFRCKNCNKRHHTTICNSKGESREYTKTQEKPPLEEHVKLANERKTRSVLLKTAIADVTNANSTKSRNVAILFDEGATRSFIRKELTDELDLKPTRNEEINLSVFGDDSPEPRRFDIVEFLVKTRSAKTIKLSAVVVPDISTPLRNLITRDISQLSYLQNLTLAHPPNNDDMFNISVLVGADYYWDIVGDNVIRGPGPTAVSSKLGYLLSGPLDASDYATRRNQERAFHIMTATYTPFESDNGITRFWELESLGITLSEIEQPKKKDSLSRFQECIEKTERGYTARLPWKDDHPPLPTNYASTAQRTRIMINRLSEETRNVYHRIITEQEARGFIERVKDNNQTEGHYLPHRAVKKDSITTPIRIVYDCSASAGREEPSLNDCLEKGPPLLNELVGIMIRFRNHPVAFTSDIEKAFLNIGLHTDDRDFTKFLWLKDANDPNSELITYRVSSVLFGSVSSPALLNVVIQTHLNENPSDVSRDLKENIYVDNVASGVTTTASGITYYKEANGRMEAGGFTLRSWASNDPELRKLATQDNLLHEEETIGLLGMNWNTQNDTIGYREYIKCKTAKPVITKREVVTRVASIYDPLGYLGPVHICAKVFIKELWKRKLDWDEPLSEGLLSSWNEIEAELRDATKITVPRQHAPGQKLDSIELHCFTDSSLEKGYGAAIYLKANKNTSIVMAKSRITPEKELTLPRLELMAAALGARLAKYVANQIHLQITKYTLWSDSQIVLCWLNSKTHLPVFVRNRVKEIHSAPFDQYKYCPTPDNPSDLLTRGISAEALEHSTFWWHGPSWLAAGDWPICKQFDNALMVETSEITHAHEDPPTDGLPKSHRAFIDACDFSSLHSLFRVTAIVLRFIAKLRKRETPKGNTFIRPQEIRNAEITWIKCVQNERYSDEIKTLRKQSERIGPLVRQLRLFLDDEGLIRCGGRIHNAPVDSEAKFPILLPSKHNFTTLVIEDNHAKTLHSGIEATMAMVRQQYWITRARQTIKSVLFKCVICRKVAGKPYRLPVPPPLQSWRLAAGQHCFTYCGLDYTGCLYVKNAPHLPETKAYVALFTCAVSRAIHLELVTDLTPRAFLNAFRRFAARRSLPRKIVSDNQSAFLVSSEELKKLFNDPEVQRYLAGKRVDWTFIPKRAPNFGGFYERLIGITKLAIKKVLGRAYVTLEELQTLLCEVEAIINDRPITHVSSSMEDMEPLTPSHLLHGRRITTVPHLDAPNNDPGYLPAPQTNIELNKRAKHLSSLYERFWQRWCSEYLPALRERHLNNTNANTENVIKVGDVVLVHSDTEKRANWKLAMVERLHYGKDGLVRSADIRLSKGRTSRPIIKLYPLELNYDSTGDTSADHKDKTHNQRINTGTNVTSVQSPTVKASIRPTRKAALEAKGKIKACLQD